MKSNRNSTNRYFIILFGLAIIILIVLIGYYLITFRSSITPILGLLVAFVAGWLIPFVLPTWQARLNAPRLSIEINSINRTISENVRIRIDNFPELQQLEQLVRPYPFMSLNFPQASFLPSNLQEQLGPDERTPQLLKDLLNQADQLLTSYKQQVDQHKKLAEEVNEFKFKSSTFTQAESERLNQELGLFSSDSIDFDIQAKENTLESFSKKIQDNLQDLNNKRDKIRNLLRAVQPTVDKLLAEYINKHSNFVVSASLINAGRQNTAVKGLAVLHVYVNDHSDDLDLRLKLRTDDFRPLVMQTKLGEGTFIKGDDMNVAIFESDDIEKQLIPVEIEKINKWWGQPTVYAFLKLIDINSEIYISNKVVFDKGEGNQESIYKRLSDKANNLGR